MNITREKSLKEIQEVSFRMFDLHLFLDTHPDCMEALNEYNSASKKYMLMKEHFERLYGPLTLSGKADYTIPWQWIQGPWPWQNPKEMEEEINVVL